MHGLAEQEIVTGPRISMSAVLKGNVLESVTVGTAFGLISFELVELLDIDRVWGKRLTENNEIV